MKTAIYARVSSDIQAEQGYSIEGQLEKLRDYCKHNKIYDFDEYVDGGYSGANLDRPEMQRLIGDIRNGKIGAVIIYKLDRLSRRAKDTLFLTEDVFLKYDVKFVSLAENIDTASSSGKFFLTMLASVAQLERDTIKERVMLGKKVKASKGIKAGVPKVLIGYDYDPVTKQYSINEYEAMHVRQIYQMYLDGESSVSIYKKMHGVFVTKFGTSPGTTTIYRILDNETYLGKMVYQGNYCDCVNVPPIIDNETFQKVKERRKQQNERFFKPKANHLLTGFLYCGQCGCRMRAVAPVGRKWYYVCYSSDQKRGLARGGKIECDLPHIDYRMLDRAIKDALKKLVGNKTYFDNVKTPVIDNSKQIITLNKEIAKLTVKANKLIDLLLDGIIERSAYNDRLQDINSRKEVLQGQITALEVAQQPREITEHSQVKKMAETVDNATTSELRQIFSKLIKKIVVTIDENKKMTISIVWNF